jgi:hypothetical protein
LSYFPPPNDPGYNYGYGYGPPPPHINNNLVWAILSTIFCCWPLGIPAIVYAAKVDGLAARGDYQGAQDAANKAKMWSIWSAVAVGVLVIIYIVILVIGASLSSVQSSSGY